MALTIKIDPAQMEQIAKLTQAVTDLSDSLAKWQAEQTAVVGQGFTDLVTTFGGTRGDDARVQAIIDQVAAGLNLTADEVQAALNKFNQPKENENGS
jgi:flagellar hook assembly protein FlgD